MTAPLLLTARVQPGHKLEIVAPELTEGEEVSVLVTQLTPALATATPEMYAPTPPGADDHILHSLLAEGVIPFIPTGRTEPPKPPIVVHGKPVSETIIEERR